MTSRPPKRSALSCLLCTLLLPALPACSEDPTLRTERAAADVTARSWCDPATWGGTVPTATTDVTVTGAVLVDCAAVARKVTVPAGTTLIASRTTSSTLTLSGNLVVRGRLDYGTPDDRVADGTTAEIIFRGMSDNRMVGTPSLIHGETSRPPADVPLVVIDSDVGVWVMGAGVFTAAGQAKTAWSRLTDGAAPGDASLQVENAAGWRAGDRLALTPTATSSTANFAAQFDERVIASVSGTTVGLTAAPGFTHAGCAGTGCIRRGEAADLSRNVIVRSLDDTAHAHMIVGEQGVLQLDSVELRWLGPQKRCSGGAPERRAPIWFHEQGDASRGSFVRHTAIWGGENHFIMVEKSHGVQISDVVGYDAANDGFALMFDASACGTRCIGDAAAPHSVVLDHVLSAKLAVPNRVEGCVAVGAVMAMIVSGDAASGATHSVATGTGYNADPFGNIGAIHWSETGSGPGNVFINNVAHNNASIGVGNWQNNTSNAGHAFVGNQAWSNGDAGFLHGAYVNEIQYAGVTAIDNAGANFGEVGIAETATPRIDGGLLDDLQLLSYVSVPAMPIVFRDLQFTGGRSPAITQDHDECDDGDENDPDDGGCIRTWTRIENPRFPAGVVPFDVGDQKNKFGVWEIRGFVHPDYPTLPANFDLYRRDNHVAGGSYRADFDAWLVPRP